MYNFLFLLVTSFCFGQSYNCLEEGIGEIISNKVELKSIKYKQLNYEREKKYIVDSKVKISLSNTSSFIELLGKKRKMSFSQMTKEDKNIFLNLENVFYLKYNKEILYIFEFKTLYQGIGSNTYNVIFSKNKGEILFKQWNSSGNGISNSFGISKNKLFVLNQIRDSISYYELKNMIITYQHNSSSLIKIDSLGKVCVQNGYKF
jgi:hypothetical protein